METQMPVSSARSTTEAKSPLRWGTREAAGTKQRIGQVGSLLCFWPQSGTQKRHVPGPHLALPSSALPNHAGVTSCLVVLAMAQPVCPACGGGCWQSAVPALHP